MQASAASLFSRTARLTRVELTAPVERHRQEHRGGDPVGPDLRHRRARSTPSSTRIQGELGAATVVATGGLAPVVIPHCRTIDHHEPWLTLEGLRLVFEKNPAADA